MSCDLIGGSIQAQIENLPVVDVNRRPNVIMNQSYVGKKFYPTLVTHWNFKARTRRSDRSYS